MNALEPLLRPFVALLNRQIRASSAALDTAAELAGKVIAIRVRDTAIAVVLRAAPDGLSIADLDSDDPDVILEGSLLALASLAGNDPLAGIRSGKVELSGDSETAELFQKLIRLSKPDTEAELSRAFGDAPGKAISDVLGTISRVGRERLGEIAENIGRRVQRSSELPLNDEFDEFSNDVRELRDRTARLQARSKQLNNPDSN